MNSQKRSNFKSTRCSLQNEMMVNFYYLDNKKEVRNLDTLYRNGITSGRHWVVQKEQNAGWLGKRNQTTCYFNNSEEWAGEVTQRVSEEPEVKLFIPVF